MKLKNNTNRTYGFPTGTLTAKGVGEFSDELAHNPVVKRLIELGEISIVETPAANANDVSALLAKIQTMKRDGLIKLCEKYGLDHTDEDEAKHLKPRLIAYLNEQAGEGNDGNPDDPAASA